MCSEDTIDKYITGLRDSIDRCQDPRAEKVCAFNEFLKERSPKNLEEAESKAERLVDR